MRRSTSFIIVFWVASLQLGISSFALAEDIPLSANIDVPGVGLTSRDNPSETTVYADFLASNPCATRNLKTVTEMLGNVTVQSDINVLSGNVAYSMKSIDSTVGARMQLHLTFKESDDPSVPSSYTLFWEMIDPTTHQPPDIHGEIHPPLQTRPLTIKFLKGEENDPHGCGLSTDHDKKDSDGKEPRVQSEIIDSLRSYARMMRQYQKEADEENEREAPERKRWAEILANINKKPTPAGEAAGSTYSDRTPNASPKDALTDTATGAATASGENATVLAH